MRTCWRTVRPFHTCVPYARRVFCRTFFLSTGKTCRLAYVIDRVRCAHKCAISLTGTATTGATNNRACLAHLISHTGLMISKSVAGARVHARLNFNFRSLRHRTTGFLRLVSSLTRRDKLWIPNQSAQSKSIAPRFLFFLHLARRVGGKRIETTLPLP